MKEPKSHIEQKLNNWRDTYKVPEGYFERFIVLQTKPVNQPLYKQKKNWAWAATLLLLVTLGFNIVFHTSHKTISSVNNNTDVQFVQTDYLFDDLTDEEIIDYLTDEDAYLDDEFEN